MRTLIIYPAESKALEKIAQDLGKLLKRLFKGKMPTFMMLEELEHIQPFIDHDLIILGTITMKDDIYWPLQVKVDALIHEQVKADFSDKIFSAYTISKDTTNAMRCIDAALWTFQETNAHVAPGLVLVEESSPSRLEEELVSYTRALKQLRVTIK